ncbi:hypothetical protein WR25_12711 isoform B [Diploscapter pachys]|uniref:MARVEL domain-containing protein n=1 Tax=Diploscapter pachys TaxID=2018661 RepID=A0A2A2LLK1_9BILA|nr:hypothetical protein WR25_12711 isoform B [Diploscapter pachys]
MMIVALLDWRTAKNDVQNGDFNDWGGLMPWSCINHSQGRECHNWWNSLPGWLKAVVILMIASLVAEIITLIWNTFVFCACCCKKYLIHPLALMAFIITVMLLTVVIIYAANAKHDIKDTDTQLGYSFWCAVGALILAAADVIIGAITVFFGENCC